MFTAEVSARRLIALLRWLPHDAAVWAGEPPSWTMERELAAVQVELTHALLRAVAQLGGAKRGRLPKALQVPRPSTTTRGRRFDHEGFMAAVASLQPKG